MSQAALSSASRSKDIHIDTEKATFHILGVTPLIFHNMSEKAKRQLLMPAPRKNAAERAVTLKHSPMEEFRASVYTAKRDLDSPTHLVFPGRAFHQAIQDATLDLPDVKKAVIGRLCGVVDFDVSIYGIPQLMISSVRSADKNRTPDMRTRAIVPQWACEVTIWFARPLLRQSSIVDLMASAGIYIGIGDWRQQKGSGSHGLWEVVDPGNEDWMRIMKTGGRAPQLAAMEAPVYFDNDTEGLMHWFETEYTKRQEPAPKIKGKKNGTDTPAPPPTNKSRRGEQRRGAN